ncbi:ParB/RepB/Spo0J family partition protein [Acaryochloris marina]|uniref:ParB/RepB/Spo0J family partition protein n=1 Tax=Acaryochloris marina TaxID=155978 RepID=UPI0021C2C548|nr:ParB/RepB/Spo0J family partition protein [Acaryochloris marina]BDM83240.1 hypothetical protein AM10699_61010 [Acaryochloris marina MBIC10699]
MTRKATNNSFNLKGKKILQGLVSEADIPQDQQSAAEWIDIDKIHPSNNQPRQYFSQESLENLAKAFKTQGFRGAINVRKVKGSTYEIVAGERRWRAAKQAHLKSVRCIVDKYTNEQALEFALVENLNREDLSRLEETEGILQLVYAKYKIQPHQAVEIIRSEGHPDRQSRSDVAPSDHMQKIMGVLASFDIQLQTFRTKHIRTLSLPSEIKEAHLKKGLPYSSALEINKVKDDSKRHDLLQKTIKEKLSFREVKQQVQGILNEVKNKKRPVNQQKVINHLETTLKRAKQSTKILQKAPKRKQLEKLLREIDRLLEEE